jgi:hypothetical protein
MNYGAMPREARFSETYLQYKSYILRWIYDFFCR